VVRPGQQPPADLTAIAPRWPAPIGLGGGAARDRGSSDDGVSRIE
jgi:hypothetical protein